jgi:protein O-mannosyl-transferase
MVTNRQLGFWENSVELFGHTAEVTRNNLRAEYNLGVALGRAGRKGESIEHYLRAIEITPSALDKQAGTQAQAHQNLGIIYAEGGDWTNAETQIRAAVKEKPDVAEPRASLAGCLIQEGRFEEAVTECQTALAINPREVQAWRWLGVASTQLGRNEQALRALREAVNLNPDGPAELNELAWFLATTAEDGVRNGTEAVSLAQRACELTRWQEPRCIGTLDAAYAEAGHFEEAIKQARQTRELALATGQTGLASAAEERLRLYVQGRSYRQKP